MLSQEKSQMSTTRSPRPPPLPGKTLAIHAQRSGFKPNQSREGGIRWRATILFMASSIVPLSVSSSSINGTADSSVVSA
jgi:hypothetical protein